MVQLREKMFFVFSLVKSSILSPKDPVPVQPRSYSYKRQGSAQDVAIE
jgi:hypothetical protein